ncbi:MAG: AAA family ATPase [Candidatus Ornithospirochaeta sp.]
MYYSARVKTECVQTSHEGWKESVKSYVAKYVKDNPGASVYMVSSDGEGYEFAISDKSKRVAEGDLLSFMSRFGLCGRMTEINEISFPSFLLSLKKAKENGLLDDESDNTAAIFLGMRMEDFGSQLEFPFFSENIVQNEKDILPCHVALEDLEHGLGLDKHYLVTGRPWNADNYIAHIVQTLNKYNVRSNHYPFLYKMTDVNAVAPGPEDSYFQWFSRIRENGIIILDFSHVSLDAYSANKLDEIVEEIGLYARTSTVIIKAGYMDENFARHFLENKVGLRFEVVDEDHRYDSSEAYSTFRTYCDRTGERDLFERKGHSFFESDSYSLKDIMQAIESPLEEVKKEEIFDYVVDDDFDTIEDERIYTKEEVESIIKEKAEDEFLLSHACGDDDARDGMEALSELIGLEEIKDNVRLVVSHALYEEERKKRGIKTDAMSRHMAFLGESGTSKTTVAGIIARIYRENGILERGDLVEVGRCDLVGKYMGETAAKVKGVFDMARGSVLFIDEAYSLLDGNVNGYGDEAIATIIQEMENHRDDTVVIFAGYPEKIAEFLERNPGLLSRVPFVFDFPSYSLSQLWDIFCFLADKKGFVLSKGVKERVLEMTEEAMENKNFGNGRFMRNLLEKAELNLARRTMATMEKRYVSDKELVTLTKKDFSNLRNNRLSTPKKKAPMGFSSF